MNVQILSRDLQCDHRLRTSRELLHGSFPVTLHLPNRTQGHCHCVAWICNPLRHPILHCEWGQFLLRPRTRPGLCVALPYPGPWRQWHDAPLQCHPLEIDTSTSGLSSGCSRNLNTAYLQLQSILLQIHHWLTLFSMIQPHGIFAVTIDSSTDSTSIDTLQHGPTTRYTYCYDRFFYRFIIDWHSLAWSNEYIYSYDRFFYRFIIDWHSLAWSNDTVYLRLRSILLQIYHWLTFFSMVQRHAVYLQLRWILLQIYHWLTLVSIAQWQAYLQLRLIVLQIHHWLMFFSMVQRR